MEQKKKQPNKSPANQAQQSEEKSERKHKLWKLLAALLIIIAIIIFWLLLRGRTTTTGKYPENVKSTALKCTSILTSYSSKIGELSEDSRETKITSIFYEGDTVNSIALEQTLTFPNQTAASSAEAVAHANFNLALRASNYSSTKFDNKFTILDNKLVVSVHGKKRDWTDFNKDYFMIKSDKMPATLAELKTEYENQGFSCEVIE